MQVRALMASLMVFAAASPAGAQHGSGAPPLRTVSPEAKQLAFLVGQYDLVVRPQVSSLAARIHGAPKLLGTWKGWRALDGFAVEDELRITDASGNPMSLSHAIRYYDSAQRKWIASGVDAYRGTFNTSSGEWRDNRFTSTSRGVDADGKPYVSRGVFYDVTATGFKFRQDRSMDDGRTWKEGILQIDATRVAASAAR